MEQAFDPPARFIHMVHFLGQQQALEDLHRRSKGARRLLYPVRQRPFGEGTRQEILKHFPNALHRQQVILRQIDRQRLDSTWKATDILMLTPRTGEDFHLMFRDNEAHDREFLDLPTLFDLPSNCSQFVRARLAMTGAMDYHLIGLLLHPKHVSRVACLPSRGFAACWTFLPFAFEAITRRRFATVMTIFGQSPL